MPPFRVVYRNGEDLGVLHFIVPRWKPGDLIPLGKLSLRVVEVEWNDEDDEVAGTLTVEVA